MRLGRGIAGAVAVALAVTPSVRAQSSFDPSIEASNYSKLHERFDYVVGRPAYQEQLRAHDAQAMIDMANIRATDPERDLGGVCASYAGDCAGDVRLDDWGQAGDGMVRDVLYTNRNGATIPGRVWATRTGPPKRPAVVIGPGGLAPQTVYWFGAAALARAGYVVFTFDVQGQGRADTRGEAPDDASVFPFDGTGVSQTDGIEDALDFLLSSPDRPYEPRPSCVSGTSHAAKQDRRVRAGLDAPYDPLWTMIDPSRIGLVGHSLGAYGVSFVGQKDPRVDAIVAWDNLEAPDQAIAIPRGPKPCAAFPDTRTPPPITKPALGLSADYHQPPEPNTSLPDPQGKSNGFHAYQRAGVDSGQIVLRGGSHYEFSFLPGPTWPASLRGSDVAVWYTIAWLDRYLRHDASADRWLLTERWRNDGAEAAVDPHGDGNAFSFYYRSALDYHRADGTRVRCDDLRAGCAALGADDGQPPYWSYLDYARGTDTPGADEPSAPAPARVSRSAAPRRISLRASRRRLAIRLSLGARTAVDVRLLHGKRSVAGLRRTLGAGRHVLRIRLPRALRPGRYAVAIALGGGAPRTTPVRVTR